MGLQNYSKNPYRRNTLQLDIWHKVVIPVEIRLTSSRTEFFDEHNNDNQLKLNLDCLDEVRD